MNNEKNNLCVNWGEFGAHSSERTHPQQPEPASPPGAAHTTRRRAPLPVPHLAAFPQRPAGWTRCAPQLSTSPAPPRFAQGSIRSPGRSLRDVATERQKSAAEQILLLRGHRAVLYFTFYQ